jgi:hypothetical protein
MTPCRLAGPALAALTGLMATSAAAALEFERSPTLEAWDRLGASATTTSRELFAVRNVYAPPGARSYSDVRIGRLVVFGDSYSDVNFGPAQDRYSNWAQKAVLGRLVTTLDSYAVAGAKAREDGGFDNLSDQIARFLATAPEYGPSDAVAIFIGYNDIGFKPNLDESMRNFKLHVRRLLDSGVRDEQRRLFLAVPFDLSRAPGNGSFPNFTPTRANAYRWKLFLEDYANDRNRIVLVDLFTAFDRVFADPETYGLTNVTTPDPANSGRTALWDDELHFGGRGHNLIFQVFRHYLTRGWDWANTLEAGADQVRQLRRDINAGIVMRLDEPVDDGAPLLRAFAVGDAYWQAVGLGQTPSGADQPDGDGGWGMDLRLDEDTRLGLVLARYDQTVDWGDAGLSGSASTEGRSVAFYLDHRLAGLELRGLVAVSDDRYETSSFVDLTDSRGGGSFDGRTITASQRLARPLDLGSALLTPWVELAHTRQSVDDYTVTSPLVSDLTYSTPDLTETAIGLGLDAISAMIPLGETAGLQLRGAVGIELGLKRQDYEIEIREAAFDGYSRTERIERGQRRTLSLSLGAAVALGDDGRLELGYGAADDAETGVDHALRLDLSWRF